MKLLFKITQYLPETQQIAVKCCRQNAPKPIDDYPEVALDLMHVDFTNYENFKHSLIRDYNICSWCQYHNFSLFVTISSRNPGTMTLSIMTLSIMTLSILTLSIMTLSIMTLSIMTLSVLTLSIMTLGIMTLSIIVLSIMAFIIKSDC